MFQYLAAWLKPFSLEISVLVRLGVRVCCRDCLSFVPVWFGRIGFWKGFLDSDETQKKRSWVSGQVDLQVLF